MRGAYRSVVNTESGPAPIREYALIRKMRLITREYGNKISTPQKLLAIRYINCAYEN